MKSALRPNPAPDSGHGRPTPLPARLTVVRVLTGLLEHLDASRKPVDPGQYRLVARRLADELGRLQPDPMMDAWMRGHPLAAEVYENSVYAYAGLCRQPLDAALAAELEAKAAIASAGRGARSAAP